MCVKEKTAVLSQQGWTWQSADRPFKNKKYEKVWNKHYIFCISKSKIEAAFRDKVSMRAVELSFLTFDSANIEFDFSIGVTVEKTFPVENKKPLKPL